MDLTSRTRALWEGIEPVFKDLVCQMTAFDPRKRITAREALAHRMPLWSSTNQACVPNFSAQDASGRRAPARLESLVRAFRESRQRSKESITRIAKRWGDVLADHVYLRFKSIGPLRALARLANAFPANAPIVLDAINEAYLVRRQDIAAGVKRKGHGVKSLNLQPCDVYKAESRLINAVSEPTSHIRSLDASLLVKFSLNAMEGRFLECAPATSPLLQSIKYAEADVPLFTMPTFGPPSCRQCS
ncbi:hypothetical protein AJ80_03173 [Polytolypa hystricis UAMH7299]|uniref:Protein kinase domain-containing protein n=1 Tax=Polytolypa hystricis (strain UAMH7299) TaxID=1447883 RepID=A0A2B7YJL9_POLH7|nr:hypothetical protein AJ80_03173 [Polytolypa hystricis UAMH7299]